MTNETLVKASAKEREVGDIAAGRVPKPVGWKILCAVPDIEHKFEGTNIVRAEKYAEQDAIATSVLFVVAVGDLAYHDKVKFPTGPWCKEGDFVLVRTYAGTRFKLGTQELRLLNDDQVDAVVSDPRGITRPGA